jgi:NitT/TauT family transport system substrate-binding protein
VGYVPNVQFAPIYVALARGFYKKAGLDVRITYGYSPNLLQLVGAGRESFAYGDGTDVILAVSHGIPVTSVATLYQQLPAAVFSLKKAGIRTLRDLRGKRLGVPGRFGSSYAGLLVALHNAAISPSALSIQTIGYVQAQSVVQGKVAAAVGFSNNEPVVLKRHGYALNVIEIGALSTLMGPGLIAGNSLIAHNPGLVRRFVQATLQGVAATIAASRSAFAISRKVHGLTTLSGSDAADQYAVLLRSIAFWHDATTRARGLGYGSPSQWQRSIRLLNTVGQSTKRPAVSAVMTDRFVTGSPRR